MRDLKFRMLTQTTDKTIGYVDIYDLLRDGADVLPDFDEAVLEGVKFEQYTGLKDKNGREIYEGDIILHHKVMTTSQDFFGTTKCNGVVKWDDEKTGFYPFNDYDIQWDLRHLAKDIEVIGNIHENPELLKGEK